MLPQPPNNVAGWSRNARRPPNERGAFSGYTWLSIAISEPQILALAPTAGADLAEW